MNLHNHRTASNQFLLALILAGLSACQPMAMPPSPAPSSPISQISPASVSSAAPTIMDRTADIVVEKIQDYIYKISWKAIPGAAYYKLFLDGELFKDKLVSPSLYLNTRDLNRGIQKIGYETFDNQNRFMGYLAQDFDIWSILPEIVNKPQDVNLKSEAEEVSLNLDFPYFSEARRYKFYLNDQLFEKGISTSRTISLKVNELESLNKISLEYFDDNFNLLKIYEQNIPYKLLLNNKKIDYTSVFSIFSDLNTIFSISYSSRRKLCSEKFPKKEIPDLIEWVDSVGELIRGEIFDDQNKPLTNTTIKIRSVNPLVNFEDQIKSNSNIYIFSCAIPGVLTEIIVTKPGYTTRRRVEVIKANKGVPNHNQYDFGTDGREESFSAPYNGLSDKPEVIQVTPARNGAGLDPKTDFILQFSEPMDRQSVEDTFTVRSFNNHKLSVDNTINKFPTEPGFKYTLHGNGLIASNADAGIGTPIYDLSAFDITWNADDTQVTFQFKNGYALPTDKTPELTPHYQVAFKPFTHENRTLRDKTGVERKEKHFKLTDGNFEESYKFKVKEDLQAPSLQATRWAGFSAQMPTLLLQYSEQMLLKTYSLNIAGGMADEAPSCKQAPAGFPGAQLCTASKAAENYQVKVTAPNGTVSYQGSWKDLGGEASYSAGDASFRTIELSSNSVHPTFVSGAQVEITASTDIVDPAGNPISNSQTPLKVLIP